MQALAIKLLDYAKSRWFNKTSCAMLLAQCHHESMGFTRLEENLNYTTVERIMSIFGNRIRSLKLTRDNIEKCVRNPQRLANTVYANRMGNGTSMTNEGWLYRGRGLIQLTGKNNYSLYDKLIVGSNLLSQPDRASLPDVAVQIAIQYFIQNKLINTSDVQIITQKINGGLNGLDERIRLYDFYFELIK
jgi:putative chitinase